MTQKERRKYLRVPVDWSAIVETNHGSLEGEVKDISVGGACILCPEEPIAGESISILLKPPEQRSIPVIGEKVWSDFFDIHYGKAFGMGIRFIHVSPEDRQYIADLVEKKRSEYLPGPWRNQKSQIPSCQMPQVQGQPHGKANWESISCLWEFFAKTLEALTALNILCDAKFQQSVD